MPLDYHFLKTLPPLEIEHSYSARDAILYALGVGAGADALRRPEALKFVYEKDLVALPTMAVVLSYPGFWAKDPKYGITWQKLLHGEQSISIHAPIPASGDVRGEMTIDEIYDRGAEKGAYLYFSRRIFDKATGTHLATVRQMNILRADGGFGGPEGPIPQPHKTPERDADIIASEPTSEELALIYRLSGDLNPLHVDPAVAGAAGFQKPILHGLSTYGIVGRVLLRELCADEPQRFKRLDTRFSSPVYPGETLEVAIWKLDRGKVAVEARSIERGTKVISNGYFEYEP